MAAHGWNLVLTARREDRLLELAHELEGSRGVRVRVEPCDLSRPDAAVRLVEAIERSGITVDALVNNAGFATYGPFIEVEWDTEREEIDVNVAALTELCKRLIPGMIKRGHGYVMNVASTAAFQPGPGMAVYFATKAYVLHLSEALAHELHGTGVTVTALCPGATASEFQARAGMEDAAMVKGRRLPPSGAVARFGYRAMLRGKRVAVHGFVNRILAWSVRLAPRRLATAVSATLTRER